VLKDAGVPIAPSTYYAHKNRKPSRRQITDAQTLAEIQRVHSDNYGVYGIRKVHAHLARGGGVGGRRVARCTVARLMRTAGLRGVTRAKTPRTTRPAATPDHRPDLVQRDFTADAPNRLWVADITYIKTHSGWVYASFVLDVFSRRIVGWQLSTSLRTELALDALEMGLWTRQRDGADLTSLIHHSDRGVQYVAVRYTERLAEAGMVVSVGSRGDSYDNAMAEAFNSIFKAELIRNKGPWRGIDDLELAVADYIDWYNHQRLHGELGLVPPVEHEQAHRHQQCAAQARDHIPAFLRPGPPLAARRRRQRGAPAAQRGRTTLTPTSDVGRSQAEDGPASLPPKISARRPIEA
jgi:putative transposase